MRKQTGNINKAKKNAWKYYYQLVDEQQEIMRQLCLLETPRFNLYHKKLRVELLLKVVTKLLSRFSTESVTTITKKIGLGDGVLYYALNTKDFSMSTETEIKIIKFIYEK